ncbi:MAG: FAD-dependent oxidoreductase [Acidobacteriia bacterium]|nr:FAD-dependent oxidoreductase [Terriglobia bacterium]
MRSLDRHTVLVGGGVIGVCCAYFLAKRGARVTVLERDQIGKAASFGNAGSIAPGHPPINKPGRVRQALKSLFHPLSPLYVAPRFDPALAKWLWSFSRTCTEEHVEFAMRTLAPLGHASRTLFDELIQTEKLRCWFCRDGYYEIYLTERGFESAKREIKLISGCGFHPGVMSGDALREREPAINDRVAGGVFYPEAATINPYEFVTEMAQRAEHYGVKFQTATGVVALRSADGHIRGVQTRNGELIEADSVVLAGGAYSVPLLHALGIRFPLQAAKGYHRDCESKEGAAPLLSHACVLGENMVFCTPMDGFVRFAGTLELSGVNHEIRQPRLEQLTKAASRYLKTMGDAKVKSEWCGLRPCLPDGLPAVGAVSRHPGLFVATGHAMMGLTLGPVTGKLIAEYVLDGSPGMDISALRPERF